MVLFIGLRNPQIAHGLTDGTFERTCLDLAAYRSWGIDRGLGLAGLDDVGAGAELDHVGVERLLIAGLGGGDELALQGRVLRVTRKVAFCEATVVGAGGEAVAAATGTQLLRRRSDS